MKVRFRFVLVLIAGLMTSAGTQAQTSISTPGSASPYNQPSRTKAYTSFDNPYAPGDIYDPYRSSRLVSGMSSKSTDQKSANQGLGKSMRNGASLKSGRNSSMAALNGSLNSPLNVAPSGMQGTCGLNSPLSAGGGVGGSSRPGLASSQSSSGRSTCGGPALPGTTSGPKLGRGNPGGMTPGIDGLADNSGATGDKRIAGGGIMAGNSSPALDSSPALTQNHRQKPAGR